MKKLVTLCLTCGLLSAIGCGDPPKTPVKDAVKKDTPAVTKPADDKKVDDKKPEVKKDEVKTGERDNKKDH